MVTRDSRWPHRGARLGRWGVCGRWRCSRFSTARSASGRWRPPLGTMEGAHPHCPVFGERVDAVCLSSSIQSGSSIVSAMMQPVQLRRNRAAVPVDRTASGCRPARCSGAAMPPLVQQRVGEQRNPTTKRSHRCDVHPRASSSRYVCCPDRTHRTSTASSIGTRGARRHFG